MRCDRETGTEESFDRFGSQVVLDEFNASDDLRESEHKTRAEKF